jgi:hypothetical protein
MMSKSVYDNLDNCINFLFNAYYAKSEKCYAITPIKRKNIIIDDLRKPINFDSKHVFEGDFKLLGEYSDRIHYKRTNKDGMSCTISIGKITKNQNDITRKELQHMAMLYTGSEIIFNEKFKGIVLPIMCFDISKDKLLEYFPQIKNDLNENKMGELMYVIITEHFFKTQTLKTYLDENISELTIEDFKTILFQIFYIIAKLSERFNNFSHRMINLNSLLVWKNKVKETKQYKLGSHVFEIESDIDIKMSDFDNSSTSDYNNIENKYNPYFDINYIMSIIYYFLKPYNKITQDLQMFFDEVLPEKFRPKSIVNFEGLNENEFDMNSDEIITAALVIKKNKFFKQFIKMDLSVSPKEFQKEKINNLAHKEEGISYIENNKKNKKSNKYYSMSTVKGSRKIAVPGFRNTGLTSEYSERSNLFTGGSDSEKTIKNVNPEETSASDKKSSSVSNRKDKSSSVSASNKKSSSISTESKSTTANDIARALKSSAKKGSHKKDSRKKDSRKKSSRKMNREMSSMMTESALSVSSGGARNNKMNPHMNSSHAKILQKLPENFLDLAPESMVRNMPSLDMHGMEGMAGMQGMQGMAGMGGMEGMNPMGMGNMQPQMSQNDMAQLAQMTAYPSMPQSMGNPGMGQMPMDMGMPQGMGMGMPGMQGMGMPGMQGMGMPGMQGMGMPGMQMMGGGSLKKYKLNRDALNKEMTSGFFF